MMEDNNQSVRMGPILRVREAVKDWIYAHDTIIMRGRRQRMLDMVGLLDLPDKCRIIDLGGGGYNWNLIEHNFDVTIVNLPGGNVTEAVDTKDFTCVTGDACDLSSKFEDNSFDLAFSNSVIEHVGDETRQQQFAGEVKRLAKAFWVQTPSNRFPFEIHSGKPLYWQRKRLMGKELRINPNLCVLTRNRMQELFAEGQFYREKLLGFEKSYAMYQSFKA